MTHLSQFILNHWTLWAALAVVLILLIINEAFAARGKAKELTPQGAVEAINELNAQVIDIRDGDAYSKGHILNAMKASASDFKTERMTKYKTKPILIVCARGLQSSQLAAKLRQEGFESPLVLGGGIDAWQAANLPLTKGKS